MIDRIKDIALETIVEFTSSDEWVFTDDEFNSFADEISKEVVSVTLQKYDTMSEKDIVELALKNGSTHKPSLGVYQFFTFELIDFVKAIEASILKKMKQL